MEIVGIPGEYKLYPLAADALPEHVPTLLADLDGFNCTIPHKVTIKPYLEALAPCASLYGAVNTVYQCVGYNTDGVGFTSCQVPLKGRRVCVLGAGGVSRVLATEAVQAGAKEVLIAARSPEKGQQLVLELKERGVQNISVLDFADGLAQFDVCLNGTPVGMWPGVRELPFGGQIKAREAVFDTIYNPTATRFVLQARTRGLWAKGGLQMLFEQALAAQKIWNPEVDFRPFAREFEELKGLLAREVLQRSPIKVVLTGFMGSGKSTVGLALAQALSLPFLDLDEAIVRAVGKSVPEIFAAGGEGAFRTIEQQIFCAELQNPEPMVLATGGGTLVQEGIDDVLRQSKALVIYLDLPLEVALERVRGDENRPMLQGDPAQITALYQARRPRYERTADLTIQAEGELAKIVETILVAFEWKG